MQLLSASSKRSINLYDTVQSKAESRVTVGTFMKIGEGSDKATYYVCMYLVCIYLCTVYIFYVLSSHIARVRVNRVRLPILLVVS